MILSALLFSLAPSALPPGTETLFALRVGRVETVSDGVLEHAVILIEDGKIITMGEDLPIQRGIPVLDLPDVTVVPGLVNCYSRMGLSSQGSSDARPWVSVTSELSAINRGMLKQAMEEGVTTIAVYPPGSGIPGRAAALRPEGELVLSEDVYVKLLMRANSSTKKMITGGFEKADEYIEKEKKAREKWDKDQEKKSKKKKKKDDDEKEEDDAEKKDDKKSSSKDSEDGYVPPQPEPAEAAFLDLRDGVLRALVSVDEAHEYLHFLDAIGEEEFPWTLRLRLNRESNLYHVIEKIGEAEKLVVVDPVLTVHPGTLRYRNLPLELHKAGAKVAFVPRRDDATGHGQWRTDVAELIRNGLDRDVALRAMTLTPAEALGLEDRIGSIAVGKDANLLFLSGDPFEPGTEILGVMLEGEVVHGGDELQ